MSGIVTELERVAAVRDYMVLFNNCHLIQEPTGGFSTIARRLVSGGYLYLKNHFILRRFFLHSNEQPVAAVIAFIPRAASFPLCLGGFLALNSVTAQEVHTLLDYVSGVLGRSYLFPLNGHINFGVSAPFPSQPRNCLGFMTTSYMPALDHLFTYEGAHLDRQFLALTTKLNKDVRLELATQATTRPYSITTRPVSLWRYRRDMVIHNNLVNVSMKDTPYFTSMTDDESWDLMKDALPLVTPELFRFLLCDGKEIGFCFAFLDYNQVMGTGRDWMKALRIITRRRKISRARIFSSGILPEFRGQGLFKFVRNEVLCSLFCRGVVDVESSYVDSENQNSLGNVRSRGGQISHRFAIFRSAGLTQ